MNTQYVTPHAILGLALLLCHSLAWSSNLSAKQVGEQVEKITRSYIGFPYKLSPLGEGSGLDPDPLIRFDLFDCTTFVETVGAQVLAKSQDPAVILSKLNDIRYAKGIPSFLSRNHFISVDWLPNNEKKKLARDMTRILFPNEYKTIYTRIDKTTWLKLNFNIVLDQPIPLIEAPFDVVYIADFFKNQEMFKKIPQGSIISLVRNFPGYKNKIGTDLEVGHLMFAIWRGDQLYVRHAKGKKEGVVEERFKDLLKSDFIDDKYAFNISVFTDLAQ